ncbi:MAG: PEP-CTERM sorting domain-containing protein [Phycisphaerae bacterium]|nr:PEP-CTERM sorting domain-containing protein [Phycisphaerae bacterium]
MKKTLGVMMVVLGCVGLASATTYDYNAEFDLSNNPSGVWTYGYADIGTGALTLYNSHAPTGGGEVNNWCYNSNPDNNGNDNKATVAFDQPTWGDGMSWEPGMTCIMSAQNGSVAPVAVFTTPSGSLYNITIEFTSRVMDGSSTDVFVIRNGNLASPLLFDSVSGFPGSSLGAPSVAGDWTVTYNATLSLGLGETIAFGVDDGEGLHQIAVEGTFTEVPEPATISLLTAGAVLGLIRGKR